MSMTEAVRTLMTAVQTKSQNLESEISDATSRTVKNAEGNTVQAELRQEEVLELQFNIGQYNALLEAASSIAKGTTDMLKTLAQRTS
jgi:type III secretion protein F